MALHHLGSRATDGVAQGPKPTEAGVGAGSSATEILECHSLLLQRAWVRSCQAESRVCTEYWLCVGKTVHGDNVAFFARKDPRPASRGPNYIQYSTCSTRVGAGPPYLCTFSGGCCRCCRQLIP